MNKITNKWNRWIKSNNIMNQSIISQINQIINESNNKWIKSNK